VDGDGSSTEARIPSSGQYSVEDALLLHSGGDHHVNGVALIACPPFSNTLVSWQSISDRLLLARFAHKHGHLSIIVAYAPTDPSEDHDKDNFYNQLSAATQSIPPHDILIVIGDFNDTSGTCDNGCSVLLKDRLPGKDLREIIGIDDVALVLQQNRLRWCGRVL